MIITLQVRLRNRPGFLGKVTSTIGREGGNIGNIDTVSADPDFITRGITVNVADEQQGQRLAEVLSRLQGVEVIRVSDVILNLHRKGKISLATKVKIRSLADLGVVYTPGVARVCEVIRRDPQKVRDYTIVQNTVAIVTDGTAVLGLGDIGPLAAMPVMEGKAMLFKEFANIDAFPICLATKEVDRIAETVKNISPGFGGINLEDISAPRCFEVEARLKEGLDIPVFHDDQHGTAVVVLAGLINALKIVGKKMDQIRVVVNGAGAAGLAIAGILAAVGTGQIIICDSRGIVYPGRKEGMNRYKQQIAEKTNPERIRGGLADALKGSDVFIGVSVPGVLTPQRIRTMAKDPIVFALANPEPEIGPEKAEKVARIVATGRSDYHNQINNVLCFPGMFRGALDVGAREINMEMKLQAAYAIANTISENELSEDYIIPSVFDPNVVPRVAQAVAEAARSTGVAAAEN
ncbi:MAG: NAD-dependent malic enzyme [Candidatus Latescibacterota bacterium]|nr:MAG: NAD-dependent malic enzyme [Candidatus Latescibacterota bacterium]RKY69379.1 MAG: NAD-dependent malic enzyme [Candidatus Latescibacterota bacterium]